MPHNDVFFDGGKSFIDSMADYSTKIVIPAVGSQFDNQLDTSLNNLRDKTGPSVDQLFRKNPLAAQGNTPLQTWNNFINNFSYSGTPQANKDAALKVFTQQFANIMKTQSDWSALSVSPEEFQKQFLATFEHFLQDYQYPATGTTTASSFYTQLHGFLTVIAVLKDASRTTPTVASYETVYYAYFNGSDFEKKLKEFFANTVKETGYFNPSQYLDKWIQKIQEEYSGVTAGRLFQQPGGINTTPTALAGANFDKTLVLDRIYRLIAQMIGTMQNITASQAQRLNMLTQWQLAYTNLLNQIHTFTLGDGSPAFINTTINNSDAKTDLNRMNDNFRSAIQGNRAAVGDDAKSLQSTINQSSDAVNQQANMATSIIQELSTLLQAIYR